MDGMETKQPEEVGFYLYKPPHWDQPREVEVVRKDDQKLYVQFVDGMYPTPMSKIPVGSLWKKTG